MSLRSTLFVKPAALVKPARDVVATLGYELLLSASALVIFPIVASRLGPADYGLYTTLYVISGFSTLWVWAGSTSALVQLLLRANRTVESVLRTTRRHTLRLAAPALPIAVGVALAIFGVDALLAALVILSTELLVTGRAETNLSTVFSLAGPRSSTRARAVLPVSRVCGVLALAALDAVSVVNLAIVNLLAALILWSVSRRALATSLRCDDRAEQTPATPQEASQLARLYATSMSTNVVQDQGDKFVLAATRPQVEVGEYGAAYRVVSFAFLPLHAVNLAANRWFLRRDDRPRSHLDKALKLLVPTSIYGIVSGVAIVVARPLTELLVGPKFEEAAQISVWLCGFPLARGLADIPVMGLLGLGENKVRTVLGVVGAFATVLVYLALVPTLGWQGAVIGTYVSEALTSSAGWALLVSRQRRRDRGELPAPDGPEEQLLPDHMEI